MGRLAGKVCIITGTGGSMGRAAALLFASEGALVVGCDVNVAAAEETVAQVRAAGGQIVSMQPCDLTRLEDCESLRELAVATHGRIDVIFNNAAMAYFDWIDTMTVEMWKNTVDQELNLVFLMTRTVWPELIKTHGTVVNMASAAAWIAYRGLPGLAHTAAKGAVLAMTRQLAMEGAPPWHPSELHLARPDRNKPDPRHPRKPGRGQIDDWADHAGPRWRAGRGGDCRPVPGVRRKQLRHRGRPQGGWGNLSLVKWQPLPRSGQARNPVTRRQKGRGPMRILTYGATGVQGGAVARRLSASGHQIRALVRDPAKLGPLPGVQAVAGDIGDRASVEAATAGVDRVIFNLPLVFDRETGLAHARNVLEAARGAGVGLVVFNTGSIVPLQTTGYLHLDLKREIEAMARALGQPMVSLRPRLYYEVLGEPWVAAGIRTNGTLAYPLPADYRASWSSVDDVAATAVACLDRPDLAGTALEVGGPEALSGGDLAAVFSKVLGRPIHYYPIPVAAFEQNLKQNFGPAVGTVIAESFHHFESLGPEGLVIPDAAKTAAGLGLRLTTLEDWIRSRTWDA